MYSTASDTVRIFSASSSGISISKASSKAITNSTVSSESAPRSSTNEAFEVTSPSSTPSCSTMICFTLSSMAAMNSPCVRSTVVTGLEVSSTAVNSAAGAMIARSPAEKTQSGETLLNHLRMLVDVSNCILHGAQLLRILVGNFRPEMLFQGHHQYDLVQ